MSSEGLEVLVILSEVEGVLVGVSCVVVDEVAAPVILSEVERLLLNCSL